MEEAIFKQCKICGCFYDVMEENGFKICPRCLEEKRAKDKKIIEKYGVNNEL